MILSFLRKPKVDVSLDAGGGPFQSGDIVKLGVHISSQDSFKLRSATVEFKCVEVYWKTVSDGKSSRQQKMKRNLYKHKEELLGETEFSSGMALNQSASFTLPNNMPHTVIGKIVNIGWWFEVKLDVASMRDVKEKKAITVMAIPTAIAVGEDGAKTATASSGDGQLALTIDSDQGAAGKTLKGTLEAAIEKDTRFDTVRVELGVKETAGEKKSSTAADKVVLEEQSSLEAGATRRWSFELTFPDSLQPSIAVSSSKIEWKMKGIIDKPMRRDFSTSIPLQV